MAAAEEVTCRRGKAEVVFYRYPQHHETPKAVEYYLCGPPMMIKACSKMLAGLGVSTHQIAYDEF